MLKYLKWQELICGIILLAAGIILLVRPELTLEIITKALGGVLIIVGVLFVLGFIIRRTPNLDSNSLVTGSIAIAAGVYIFMKSADFVKLVPMMLGIGVIISGIFKVQRALELAKMHYRSWVWLIIVALVNIMAGLIIVLNPAVIANLIMKLIGACLVFSGALDIITTFFISHRFSVFTSDKEVAGTAKEEPVYTNYGSQTDAQTYTYDNFGSSDPVIPTEDSSTDSSSSAWEETEL